MELTAHATSVIDGIEMGPGMTREQAGAVTIVTQATCR
jgi:hypothetical protein